MLKSDVRLVWLTGCALFCCLALAVEIFTIDSTDRQKKKKQACWSTERGLELYQQPGAQRSNEMTRAIEKEEREKIINNMVVIAFSPQAEQTRYQRSSKNKRPGESGGGVLFLD